MEKITYKEFKEFKKNYDKLDYFLLGSKFCYEALKRQKAFKKWKEKYNFSEVNYPDADNVLHDYKLENGYILRFKAEPYYDIYDNIHDQGYSYETLNRYSKPQFAVEGSKFSRYSNDELYYFCDLSNDRDYIPALFTLPKEWVKQFYNNKDFSKHEAYNRMVTSAKSAIESDVNYYKDYFYTCIIEIIDPNGLKVDFVCIGACDEKYSFSGLTFYEHNLINEAMEIIKNDIGLNNPLDLQENYNYAYAI